MKLRSSFMLLLGTLTLMTAQAQDAPMAVRIGAAPAPGATATASPAATADGKVQMVVNLTYDDTALTPMYINLKGSNGYAYSSKVYAKTHMVDQFVPPGTYDVHVALEKYDPSRPVGQQIGDAYSHPVYLIAENVVVNADGDGVDLDVADATHLVRFAPRARDGQPFRYPTSNTDGTPNTAGANVLCAVTAHALVCRDYGYMYMSYITANRQLADGSSAADCQSFWVNDVSDRYSFIQAVVAEGVNDNAGLHVLQMGCQGVPQEEITNADYVLRDQGMVHTPAYDSYRRDQWLSGAETDMYLQGIYIYKYPFNSTTAEAPLYWMAVQPVPGAEATFDVFPRLYERDLANGNAHQTLILHGLPEHIAGDGSVTLGHATNPYFAIGDPAALQGRPGDNVPAACVIAHSAKADDGGTVITYDPRYIGQYGEVRESDVDAGLAVRVTHDGDEVFYGLLSKMGDWAKAWTTASHDQGVVEATFTNTNITVDGMPGVSTNVMTYDEAPDKYGLNDHCAPAIQAVALRDPQGRATIHHLPGQPVALRFAAIDANGASGQTVNTMALQNRNVRVEYAPHGSQEWTAAPAVTVLQDQAGTATWTVYGTAFTPAAEDYYDLRLTLTDFVGNTTVQTLSPAFAVTAAAPTGAPWAGEGTAESPYLIQSVADLNRLAMLTSADTQLDALYAKTYEGVHFRLTQDLDFQGQRLQGISVSHASTLLYQDQVAWRGVFDGDGHAIHNAQIGRVRWAVSPQEAAERGVLPTVDTDASNDDCASEAFMGRVGAGGVLRGLTIAEDCTVEGYSALAPLASLVRTGGVVEDCRNHADVISYSTMAGGVVADIEDGGEVRRCLNTGAVTTAIMYAGGITSRTMGLVQGCANTGDVRAVQLTTNIDNDQGVSFLYNVGGIVGEASAPHAQVTDCLNAGSVTGLNAAGGISGTYTNVSSSLNIGMVDGPNGRGQLVGNKTKASNKYFHHAYYDCQTSSLRALGAEDYWEDLSAGVRATFPTLTKDLISGTALEGLDAATWDFAAGLYPVPAAFTDDATVTAARSAVAVMAPSDNAAIVTSDISLPAIGAGVEWAVTGGLRLDAHAAVPVALGAATLTATHPATGYTKAIPMTIMATSGIDAVAAPDGAADTQYRYYDLQGRPVPAGDPGALLPGQVYVRVPLEQQCVGRGTAVRAR